MSERPEPFLIVQVKFERVDDQYDEVVATCPELKYQSGLIFMRRSKDTADVEEHGFIAREQVITLAELHSRNLIELAQHPVHGEAIKRNQPIVTVVKVVEYLGEGTNIVDLFYRNWAIETGDKKES